MTASNSPSFTLRRQRDGLRHRALPAFARQRGADPGQAALDAPHGTAMDCVFKRMPAIGDAPLLNKQRW